MGFFFSTKSLDYDKKSGGGRVDKNTLRTHGCVACPLKDAKAKTPRMEPYGSITPLAYFLGIAPGAEEDKRGRPFIGPSGGLLQFVLPREWKTGDFSDKIRYNNVVRDKLPRNREPTWVEIECCRNYIVKDIEETKPKVVVALGAIPMQWVLGRGGIGAWRGRFIPIKIGTHTCWCYLTYHPANILRAENERFDKTGVPQKLRTAEGKVFSFDIKNVCGLIPSLPAPPVEDSGAYYNGITCITGHGSNDYLHVCRWLEKFHKDESVSIDIETNGLRPYGLGSKILSIAIGTRTKVVAFGVDHKGAGWTSTERKYLKAKIKEFLETSDCIKVAHNLNFEMEWFSYHYGKTLLRSSAWGDTMAQAYALDERAHNDVLKLDSLCFQYFGFNLKDISRIDVKNLESVKLEEVLLYNALDAKYCHKLFIEQRKAIEDNNLLFVYNEQVRRIPTMVLAQQFGLLVDRKKVKQYQEELEVKTTDVMNRMANNPFVDKFRHVFGKPFNIGSPDHCAMLLADVLGYPAAKPFGKYKSDKAILDQINDPIVKDIKEYRANNKLKSTYTDPLEFGVGKAIWPDGLVHTNYNTMFVITGRLSSDGPNVQNFPKVNNAWIRSVITAPKGCKMLKCDYGQIEVRVVAMYSKDPRLCEVLWTDYDIHMEWAEKLVTKYPNYKRWSKSRDTKTMMGDLRQRTKGGFVFASLYGSTAKSVANKLKMPENIVEGLLEEFWDELRLVKKWQDDLITLYDRQQYVETLSGRRRRAPIRRTQIINAPIQAGAGDIVVDAMNRLSERAQAEDKWQYQARVNLHDDLTFYINEDTQEDDMETIIGEMLAVPFDFVNVPINIEAEIGPNWYESEKVGTFRSDQW